METGGKSTESRRMRVRVINLNPKMAEEKELHETLKLLRKREPAKQWETTVPPLEACNGKNQNQPRARKELWEARSLVPGGREGSAPKSLMEEIFYMNTLSDSNTDALDNTLRFGSYMLIYPSK